MACATRPQTIESHIIMTNFAPVSETVLGLDVAQDTITFHDLITRQTLTIANTHEALREALSPFAGTCRLAVCEATGGHEAVLLGVLWELSIPAHRADGARINAFARSIHIAKTDRLDARILALYAHERGANLARWTPLPQHQQQLTTLVRRRTEMVEMRKAERTRAKGPTAQEPSMAASLKRSLRFFDAEIQALEKAIAALIACTRQISQRYRVLQELPGVGPTVAATLLALMPEIGSLSRRQAAALAGVAPHPNQTGTTRNRARMQGGRRQLRPVLFIAALTAIRGDNSFAEFYRRLIKAGKPKRLAIVAVTRKIVVVANARLAACN